MSRNIRPRDEARQGCATECDTVEAAMNEARESSGSKFRLWQKVNDEPKAGGLSGVEYNFYVNPAS